jgi:hypothetical protein
VQRIISGGYVFNPAEPGRLFGFTLFGVVFSITMSFTDWNLITGFEKPILSV